VGLKGNMRRLKKTALEASRFTLVTNIVGPNKSRTCEECGTCGIMRNAYRNFGGET